MSSSSLNPASTTQPLEHELDPNNTDELRHFNRTPRPYFHERGGVVQDEYSSAGPSGPFQDHLVPVQPAFQQSRSGRSSIAGSESGTEADDERPNFVKALPPATVRLRKGLKTGEENEDALLTPSQLDDQEGRLSREYFRRAYDTKAPVDQNRLDEEKFYKLRAAEFVRRLSEVALMGVMLICVLCGKGVLNSARRWMLELISHLITIAVLILAYPVKLSTLDAQSTHRRIWQRFRVPASFDPATILYPPLLPVLVALSVSPSNPKVLLPNIILGLASLPQRLFPRSSRLGGFNTVHWLVSVIPLIVAETIGWSHQVDGVNPLSDQLAAETLVSLYPLHHALLQPLYNLTKTSLLISELHLLSVVLIDLLLLASSPQVVILKACLWIGGATLLVLCSAVLHWNVTLARVPKWKLRRPGHSAEERKSLVDAVSDLINFQRAAAAFKSVGDADSDADEDEPVVSLKKVKPGELSKLSTANLDWHSDSGHVKQNSFSAVEPCASQDSVLGRTTNGPSRPRRNTVGEPEKASGIFERVMKPRKKRKASSLLWCLQLTPSQAQRRKWLYAAYVYVAIIAVILGPVSYYVSRHALHGQEPIAWALSYMFGQIPFIRSTITTLGLDAYVQFPHIPENIWTIPITLPPHINTLRFAFGLSTVRLLLIAYWGVVLLIGLLTVFSLSAFVEVDTRRKVFHGVMVAMLVPAIFVDPCYCGLALALALAVFLLLEVIRAGQIPPADFIGRFVAPYVDGRDLRGPVVVSHIFLLIGCAVPLWFSLASIPRSSAEPWIDWELADNSREVSMIAGVVCVGMGDAAASLIGRRYGRHKWIWVGGKSLEGSAAFAAAVSIGLMAAKAWLLFGGWSDATQADLGSLLGREGWVRFGLSWGSSLGKAFVCACGASFMEAVLTGANDNVVVPVALWLLVKGLRV